MSYAHRRSAAAPADRSAALHIPSVLQCGAYRRAIHRLEQFARHESVTVLIEGEMGTGKTMLARQLHDMSPRARAPFQHVMLSSLDDSLASSELFGHVAGAFTGAKNSRLGAFASAEGGSLFLDEIGKASRCVQQKLLHAIEHKVFHPVGGDRAVRVDVRVICATNVSLEQMVAHNQFLPDLLARMAHFRVRLPPLRDLADEIPHIAQTFLDAHAKRSTRPCAPRIHPDVMLALRHAPWPGNLRELDQAMLRLLIEAEDSDFITLDHCRDDLAYLRAVATQEQPLTSERIADAVREGGSVSAAARLLGVNRRTIQRRQRKEEGTGMPSHPATPMPRPAPEA